MDPQVTHKHVVFLTNLWRDFQRFYLTSPVFWTNIFVANQNGPSTRLFGELFSTGEGIRGSSARPRLCGASTRRSPGGGGREGHVGREKGRVPKEKSCSACDLLGFPMRWFKTGGFNGKRSVDDVSQGLCGFRMGCTHGVSMLKRAVDCGLTASTRMERIRSKWI